MVRSALPIGCLASGFRRGQIWDLGGDIVVNPLWSPSPRTVLNPDQHVSMGSTTTLVFSDDGGGLAFAQPAFLHHIIRDLGPQLVPDASYHVWMVVDRPLEGSTPR